MVKKAKLQKLETCISRQKLKSNIHSPDKVNTVVENVLVGIGEESFLKAAIELLYCLYSEVS